jgi:PilZ domain
MDTKRFWGPSADERRARDRVSADFYAIELDGGARYLRHVANVSRDGLLIESPLADERPGQVLELELPRAEAEPPVRVRAEVVRVTPDGRVGVRRLDSTEPLPVDTLGGPESL